MPSNDADRVIELLEEIRDELKDESTIESGGGMEKFQSKNERETNRWGTMSDEAAAELLKTAHQLPCDSFTAKMLDPFVDLRAASMLPKLYQVDALDRRKVEREGRGRHPFAYELTSEAVDWIENYDQ